MTDRSTTVPIPYTVGPAPFVLLLACLGGLTVIHEDRAVHTLGFASTFTAVVLAASYLFGHGWLSLEPGQLRLRPPGLFQKIRELPRARVRGARVVTDPKSGLRQLIIEQVDGPAEPVRLRNEALAQDLVARISLWCR